MKILITGSNGLLGQHLIKLLIETTGHTILATGRGASRLPFDVSDLYDYFSLDITDGVAVNDFMLAHEPEMIIHAAAMTQPDECELHEVECWNVNVTATRFLLDAAKKINARFIYISTDFVFDGINGPYKETDIPGPVNYYGSSKLAAEKSVMESGLQWAIVRTVLVYGNILVGNRSNVISWVKENLITGKPIKVVSDQWRTPTYVEDLAKGILLVLEKNAAGIYHISGEEGMSPYDMAVATADYLHLDKSLMTKVNAATFTQPAKRPLRTGFVIDKAKKELGYKPMSFKEALKKMLG
ncbi:MAG: SDR family oxidoreductase [Chitinophagaceae bacterium]|nr:SDR family oxidoreductase [Chitinophagaceae bacterium]